MKNTEQNESSTTNGEPLVRGLSLSGATALNMIDMIGVGPFITIPLIVAAMGGPQAMLGWIFGAVFALCDGLVWAELGAAMPGAGGSYRYLKEMYGPRKLGRMLSFLFIFQLSFSAPLSVASGCIGLAQYAAYLFPTLDHTWMARSLALGPIELRVLFNAGTLVALGTVIFIVFLLYRGVLAIERISKFLWVGVMGTLAWVIVAGITHFNPTMALDFPPNAFHIDHRFFMGLGAAMLVATYDYWGYYNVAFLGGEVRNPEKTIPRALILSIVAVASIYIVMNISILGVMPWRELVASADSGSRFYVIATMMQRLYGSWAGILAAVLIMWTAFASVFSLLLGYSRVPYAAARDGNYFSVFSRLHPRQKFPTVSLLALGGIAMLACFLRLGDVIAALVVIRILIQFLVQIAGLIIWRARNPEAPRPFRMWLYPVPAILAFGGFVYVLFMRTGSLQQISVALVILFAGSIIYLLRSWRRREWPFANVSPENMSDAME